MLNQFKIDKNMRKYLKPALSVVTLDGEEIMAALSLHDEIGDGQLGKATSFEEEADNSYSNMKSVWDD